MDFAAKACIQAATAPASATHDAVYHILNASNATTWQTVHNSLRAKGIKFDVLPRREWVQKLRASDPDLQRNPTFKLVDFFAAKVSTKRVYRPPTHPTVRSRLEHYPSRIPHVGDVQGLLGDCGSPCSR